MWAISSCQLLFWRQESQGLSSSKYLGQYSALTTNLSGKVLIHAIVGQIYLAWLRKVYFDKYRTIGYGEVSKIKPAKVLLKEQKDQLMIDKKLESLDNPQGQEQQAQNVECT